MIVDAVTLSRRNYWYNNRYLEIISKLNNSGWISIKLTNFNEVYNNSNNPVNKLDLKKKIPLNVKEY